MTKGDLTQVQLRRLLEQIRRRRDYFDARLARMNALKFKESDSCITEPASPAGMPA